MQHTSTEQNLTSCEVSEWRSSVGSKPLTTLQRDGNDFRVDAAGTSGLTDVEHRVSRDVLFQM